MSDTPKPAVEKAGDGLAEAMQHNTTFAPLFTASLMSVPLVKTKNRLFATMRNRESGARALRDPKERMLCLEIFSSRVEARYSQVLSDRGIGLTACYLLAQQL